MLQNSLPPPTYTVRIQCLLPATSSQPSSLIVTPDNSNPVMTTTTKSVSPNSFGLVSPKTSTSQTTCNICKRLLYSFEEILLCRVCHGSYHWRCVKPQTISHYGEHENFICDKCNDGTTPSSTHPTTNGGIKIKSADSAGTDYRDFAGVPSKINSTPTTKRNVVKSVRYFEEKQQQQLSQTYKTSSKVSDLDGYLPSQANGNEYLHRNGQYNDDSRTTRLIQEQKNEIEIDDDNGASAMFQANYRYTPLKEYAATRNGQTTNDNNTNGYPNSSSGNSDRQTTSRYGGGLQYTNHGYDPTVSRLVEVPSSGSVNFTSPTIDNLSLHNRQHHFISTTNLNVNDKSSHHQKQNDIKNSLIHSTPYLSQIRDVDSPVLKSSSQQLQHADHHSAVNSDSGIVMVNSNYSQQPDENHLVEKKLTDLVQQLGKQLENDAQKLNEKLELKLKNLENMIHQQTYVIRRQDEVIERLKTKILKIETQRDHFRERLSQHEQREQDEKTNSVTNEVEHFSNQDEQDNHSNEISLNKKYSNTSTTITENSKPSTKKAPAPRVDHQWLPTNNENEPGIPKLIKTIHLNRERHVSDSSSAPSMTSKLTSSVPLIETPAAASRLDNIIHQSNTKDAPIPPSSSYNLAQVRHQGRPQAIEPVSMEQQEIVTSVHHDDNDGKMVTKQKRSSSSSSLSSNSSDSTSQPAKTFNGKATNNTTTTNRNSNKHRSFELLPRTNQNDQGLKPTHKTASLEFGTRPMQYDNPGSIYITPVEANYPAIQSNAAVKGWLRKQNRSSFLKRIERYYCVLTNNALLMHRHDHDRTPQKAINLKGAKVLYYDDAKYGPSIELTWSNRSNDPKLYHLYVSTSHEAEQWVDGIQTTIHNLENKNKWQRYQLNT